MPTEQQATTRPNAFTLVEILIVVVILGIIALILIVHFGRSTDLTKQTAFITDVRTYVQAAQFYTGQTGMYLEDSSSGQVPAGFDPYINPDKFVTGTPLGGVWDFELNSFGVTSAFGVHFQGTAPPEDEFMRQIDEKFDDGNLNTGAFRKIANDRFYYVLAD